MSYTRQPHTGAIQKAIAAAPDAKCFIWSDEHGAWWRSHAQGYTLQNNLAGTYTLSDAYDRTRHCEKEKRFFYYLVDSKKFVGLHHRKPQHKDTPAPF